MSDACPCMRGKVFFCLDTCFLNVTNAVALRALKDGGTKEGWIQRGKGCVHSLGSDSPCSC